MIKKITEKIDYITENNRTLNLVRYDKQRRLMMFTLGSLLINISYAIYNGVLGIVYGSYWFVTMFAYYILLSAMRFGAVIFDRKHGQNKNRKSRKNIKAEKRFVKFNGVMFVLMSFVLGGINLYISLKNTAQKQNEIIMISIAAFTFYKLTLAIINFVKTAKHSSLLEKTVRNISVADAIVSVYSLQRSMLVSFKGMTQGEIKLMNILTGTGVFIIVFLMGIAMIGGFFSKSKSK